MQRVVGVLNWEALGHPLRPPTEVCACSDTQWDMICGLERLITYSLHTLGRCGEKFSTLIRAAEELPDAQEVDLFAFVNEIASDLDSYNRPDIPVSPAPSSPSKPDPSSNLHGPEHNVTVPSSSAKPVNADRIKWEDSPPFHPVPYFTDAIVRDAFLDPASVGLPPSKWVEKLRGRVRWFQT